MIDKSLYASIDASRSLINSGITLTTKMIWDVDTSALVPAGNPTTRSYTPAPDLGEMWAVMPIGMTLIKRAEGVGIFFKTREGSFEPELASSAVDGLIYALMWYRKVTDHKRKAEIMVKRLIDSYCYAEDAPDSIDESSIYLGVRQEVINLLEKALKEGAK